MLSKGVRRTYVDRKKYLKMHFLPFCKQNARRASCDALYKEPFQTVSKKKAQVSATCAFFYS